MDFRYVAKETHIPVEDVMLKVT